MLTEKDYCDYETCVALRELGYIGSSRYYYTQRDNKFHYDAYNKLYTVRTASASDYVLAIHLYAAQKWLREVRNLHIEVGYNPILSWYVYRVWEHQDEIAEGEAFPTYEDALKTAIYMATEFLKEERK